MNRKMRHGEVLELLIGRLSSSGPRRNVGVSVALSCMMARIHASWFAKAISRLLRLSIYLHSNSHGPTGTSARPGVAVGRGEGRPSSTLLLDFHDAAHEEVVSGEGAHKLVVAWLAGHGEFDGLFAFVVEQFGGGEHLVTFWDPFFLKSFGS